MRKDSSASTFLAKHGVGVHIRDEYNVKKMSERQNTRHLGARRKIEKTRARFSCCSGVNNSILGDSRLELVGFAGISLLTWIFSTKFCGTGL
jgi:hypothetical protein